MYTRNGKRMLKYARFCNSVCKESYREDRKHGLIYPAVNLELDQCWKVVSHYTACLFTRACPYCGQNETN